MTTEDQQPTTSLSADLPIGKFALTGGHLNTIFTVLGFVLTAVLLVLVVRHADDDKQTKQDFTQSIKELTKAQNETTAVGREQNCLMSLPQDQRAAQREFCRQVTGVGR